ncbi:MAG TPA: DUF6600 domain-containing protein [Verrucomicrobiae bacterium]|nr:DUF6600 domain-containing protein [Verrucomicrobiae bacterium]
MRKISSLLFFPLLLAVALALAAAQPASAEDDPPGRVARLNYIQGSVSFQGSGDKDWTQADPNRPLTTGDNLWSDRDSRGEVHIGSTAIRLSGETGISFLNLDDRTIQLQLAQGSIEIHLRQLLGGEAFEVDTPNLSFTLTRAGEYRIEADPATNSTDIIVREGEGQVSGGGESYDLREGQRYEFTGTEQLSYDARRAPGFDDFEDWCQSRDQRENRAVSAQYVSRDVDGYYELDDYGDWQNDPEYGAVWVPRGVPGGWAPYHTGHWVWISPWGWTWVDEEPWGFAPFHYGRWAYVRGGWGWVPGPLVVRPVYAPALVGFVGGGAVSVTVALGGGFAGVAWFPLGPRDVYVPSYRCSPRYVETVNVTNTRVVNVTQVTNVYNNYTRNVNITNNYTYAHNTTAVTAVSKETFVNARPVGPAAVRVTPEQIRSARAIESSPLAPTRASYVSATAKAATAKPAVPLAQRPVVARLNPAVPVNARRGPIYSNESRPFNQQTTPPATQIERPVRTDIKPPSNTVSPPPRDGLRTFQPPSAVNNAAQPQVNNSELRGQNNVPYHSEALPQNQERPAMKFTPPVKAREEMYDVHPALNRKEVAPERREEAPKPAPRKEEPPKPAPRQVPHEESRPRS